MSSRGRGGKFNKVKRGGSRKFTPARVLREDGNDDKEGMWSEPREKKEINSSSEEEEEHDSEGVSEEEASSSPKIQNQASTINNSTSSENPNRAQKSNMKLSDLNDSTGPMNRREREAAEKERAKKAYWKAHLEGKTDQAKADLARLAIIRKQREEAAAKKKEEAANKGKATGAKAESLNAGKATITKRLGKN